MSCYSCQWMHGMGERECLQDPPPSRYLTDCARKLVLFLIFLQVFSFFKPNLHFFIEPQCWKKYSHHNGNTNVQRYCVSYASDRSTCQRSTFQDPYSGEMIPATECTCNSDGCNGSTNYHQSSANYNGLVMMSLGMMVFSRVALQDLLR